MDETAPHPTEQLRFSTIDYVLFCGMLAVSIFIGVYYGFIAKRKQNTTDEYLLGSKSMKVIPVAISLTATHLSATTLIGVPAEMYRYGSQYWACVFSGLVVTLTLAYIYMPVFYDVQTASCYVYLEKRFNKNLRQLASSLFLIYSMLVVPLLIYSPAIALSAVTGYSVHLITPVIMGVCIFYTSFGGLRAVIMADTLQFASMIVAIVVVMILGTVQLGGVGSVFEIADRGGRLVWFNMDTDPYLRTSFWMVSLGLTALWVSNVGVTPECIQRFNALPSKKDAKKVIWIFGVGHIIVKLLSVYNGLIIFGKYETCDPVYEGKIKNFDQIFPYYVMDVAQSLPGLSGMFVVGVISAALSSVSSLLNILSGIVFDDFVKPCFRNATDQKASHIMKVIVVVIGLICLALVLLVEKMGSVFSIGITMGSVTYGTMLGLFTLGMLSPSANSKGVMVGSIASFVIVAVMATGSNTAIIQNRLKYPTLPFRIDGCGLTNDTLLVSGLSNITTYIANNDGDPESVPWYFRISFMYYSMIGTIITMAVGYAVSLMYPESDPYVDDILLAPFMRQFNPQRPKGEKDGYIDIHNVITSTDMKMYEEEMKMLKDNKSS